MSAIQSLATQQSPMTSGRARAWAQGSSITTATITVTINPVRPVVFA
jgi:hypothetical protein